MLNKELQDILTLPFYKTWLLPEKIILKRTLELKLIARSFQAESRLKINTILTFSKVN